MNRIIKQKSTDSISRLLYRAPYCDILMMARFSGMITEHSLRQALIKARLKYPLLNSRILQDEKGDTEFVFDCDLEFPVIVFEDKEQNDWLKLSWDEQKIPFDLNNGPLIKFLLIYTPDTTDLVVICHHCICDGLSLAYLLRDISVWLADPEAQVQPLPVPPTIVQDNLKVKIPFGFTGFMLRILAGLLNRAWNKSSVIFNGQDYEKLYTDYWNKKDIGLLAFSLSHDITSALIDCCHKNNVTVNSALTTAFSLAQNDLQGRKQPYLRKALLAMSIRHMFRDNPGDNFGLLAVGNEINLPFGKDGFWKVAARFNATTKQMLANPSRALALIAPLGYVTPTLFDAIYFAESGILKNRTADRFKNIVLSRSGKPKRSLDITNLGVLKDCADNLNTVFFVPILSSNYEKTLGIVTINDEMNIVIMHDCRLITDSAAQCFKQAFVDHIVEAL